MDSLSDEFAKRMAETPDRWTLAWWQKQFEEVKAGYRGACHAINRALAEISGFNATVETLRERCESLEKERDEANARIGELQAEFSEMSERVDRMAHFLNQKKEELQKT